MCLAPVGDGVCALKGLCVLKGVCMLMCVGVWCGWCDMWCVRSRVCFVCAARCVNALSTCFKHAGVFEGTHGGSLNAHTVRTTCAQRTDLP